MPVEALVHVEVEWAGKAPAAKADETRWVASLPFGVDILGPPHPVYLSPAGGGAGGGAPAAHAAEHTPASRAELDRADRAVEQAERVLREDAAPTQMRAVEQHLMASGRAQHANLPPQAAADLPTSEAAHSAVLAPGARDGVDTVRPERPEDRYARLAGWLGIPATVPAIMAAGDDEDDDSPRRADTSAAVQALNRMQAGLPAAVVEALNQHLDDAAPAAIVLDPMLSDAQALERLESRRDRLADELGLAHDQVLGAEGIRRVGEKVDEARKELTDALPPTVGPLAEADAAIARAVVADAAARLVGSSDEAEPAGPVVAAASTYLALTALLDLVVSVHRRNPNGCLNNAVTMMEVLYGYEHQESPYEMPNYSPLAGHGDADVVRASGGGTFRSSGDLDAVAASLARRPGAASWVVYNWLDTRVVDGDRKDAAERLARHLAEGLLDLADYNRRIARVRAAAQHADLRQALSGLPKLRNESADERYAGKVRTHLVLMHSRIGASGTPEVVVLDINSGTTRTAITPEDLAGPNALLKRAVAFREWKEKQGQIEGLSKKDSRVWTIEFDDQGKALPHDNVVPISQRRQRESPPPQQLDRFARAGHRPPDDSPPPLTRLDKELRHLSFLHGDDGSDSGSALSMKWQRRRDDSVRNMSRLLAHAVRQDTAKSVSDPGYSDEWERERDELEAELVRWNGQEPDGHRRVERVLQPLLDRLRSLDRDGWQRMQGTELPWLGSWILRGILLREPTRPDLPHIGEQLDITPAAQAADLMSMPATMAGDAAVVSTRDGDALAEWRLLGEMAATGSALEQLVTAVLSYLESSRIAEIDTETEKPAADQPDDAEAARRLLDELARVEKLRDRWAELCRVPLSDLGDRRVGGARDIGHLRSEFARLTDRLQHATAPERAASIRWRRLHFLLHYTDRHERLVSEVDDRVSQIRQSRNQLAVAWATDSRQPVPEWESAGEPRELTPAPSAEAQARDWGRRIAAAADTRRRFLADTAERARRLGIDDAETLRPRELAEAVDLLATGYDKRAAALRELPPSSRERTQAQADAFDIENGAGDLETRVVLDDFARTVEQSLRIESATVLAAEVLRRDIIDRGGRLLAPGVGVLEAPGTPPQLLVAGPVSRLEQLLAGVDSDLFDDLIRRGAELRGRHVVVDEHGRVFVHEMTPAAAAADPQAGDEDIEPIASVEPAPVVQDDASWPAAHEAITNLLEEWRVDGRTGERPTDHVAFLPDPAGGGLLVVAAPPGRHRRAMVELALASRQFEGANWRPEYDCRYLAVEPGTAGPVATEISAVAAEGAHRAASPAETEGILLDEYLRYRRLGLVDTGFGDWLAQLGDRCYKGGLARDGTVQAFAVAAAREQPTVDKDLPHPTGVLIRVATRQFALPDLIGPRAGPVVGIATLVGTVDIGGVTAEVELYDDDGVWRVAPPRGDGHPGDVLNRWFEGRSDADPDRLLDRLAHVLNDGAAALAAMEPAVDESSGGVSRIWRMHGLVNGYPVDIGLAAEKNRWRSTVESGLALEGILNLSGINGSLSDTARDVTEAMVRVAVWEIERRRQRPSEVTLSPDRMREYRELVGQADAAVEQLRNCAQERDALARRLGVTLPDASDIAADPAVRPAVTAALRGAVLRDRAALAAAVGVDPLELPSVSMSDVEHRSWLTRIEAREADIDTLAALLARQQQLATAASRARAARDAAITAPVVAAELEGLSGSRQLGPGIVFHPHMSGRSGALVVVAPPGGHAAALTALTLEHREFADAIYNWGLLINYLQVAVEPDGRIAIEEIEEGSVGAPRGRWQEADVHLLHQYSVFREAGVTTLGFGEWTRQLGKDAFNDPMRLADIRKHVGRAGAKKLTGGPHALIPPIELVEVGHRMVRADPTLDRRHPAHVLHRLKTRRAAPLPLGERRSGQLSPRTDPSSSAQREAHSISFDVMSARVVLERRDRMWYLATGTGNAISDILAVHFADLSAKTPRGLIKRIETLLRTPPRVGDNGTHALPKTGLLTAFDSAGRGPGSPTILVPRDRAVEVGQWGVAGTDAARWAGADWHRGGYSDAAEIIAHVRRSRGTVVGVVDLDDAASAFTVRMDGDVVTVEEQVIRIGKRGVPATDVRTVRGDEAVDAWADHLTDISGPEATFHGLAWNSDGTPERPLPPDRRPSGVPGRDIPLRLIGAHRLGRNTFHSGTRAEPATDGPSGPIGARPPEDAPDGTQDFWTAAFDGLTTNIDMFNDLLRQNPELSPEEAAARTFTGRMASRRGFTHVRIDHLDGVRGEYHSVVVTFTAPGKAKGSGLPHHGSIAAVIHGDESPGVDTELPPPGYVAAVIAGDGRDHRSESNDNEAPDRPIGSRPPEEPDSDRDRSHRAADESSEHLAQVRGRAVVDLERRSGNNASAGSGSDAEDEAAIRSRLLDRIDRIDRFLAGLHAARVEQRRSAAMLTEAVDRCPDLDDAAVPLDSEALRRVVHLRDTARTALEELLAQEGRIERAEDLRFPTTLHSAALTDAARRLWRLDDVVRAAHEFGYHARRLAELTEHARSIERAAREVNGSRAGEESQALEGQLDSMLSGMMRWFDFDTALRSESLIELRKSADEWSRHLGSDLFAALGGAGDEVKQLLQQGSPVWRRWNAEFAEYRSELGRLLDIPAERLAPFDRLEMTLEDLAKRFARTGMPEAVQTLFPELRRMAEVMGLVHEIHRLDDRARRIDALDAAFRDLAAWRERAPPTGDSIAALDRVYHRLADLAQRLDTSARQFIEATIALPDAYSLAKKHGYLLWRLRSDPAERERLRNAMRRARNGLLGVTDWTDLPAEEREQLMRRAVEGPRAEGRVWVPAEPEISDVMAAPTREFAELRQLSEYAELADRERELEAEMDSLLRDAVREPVIARSSFDGAQDWSGYPGTRDEERIALLGRNLAGLRFMAVDSCASTTKRIGLIGPLYGVDSVWQARPGSPGEARLLAEIDRLRNKLADLWDIEPASVTGEEAARREAAAPGPLAEADDIVALQTFELLLTNVRRFHRYDAWARAIDAVDNALTDLRWREAIAEAQVEGLRRAHLDRYPQDEAALRPGPDATARVRAALPGATEDRRRNLQELAAVMTAHDETAARLRELADRCRALDALADARAAQPPAQQGATDTRLDVLLGSVAAEISVRSAEAVPDSGPDRPIGTRPPEESEETSEGVTHPLPHPDNYERAVEWVGALCHALSLEPDRIDDILGAPWGARLRNGVAAGDYPGVPDLTLDQMRAVLRGVGAARRMYSAVARRYFPDLEIAPHAVGLSLRRIRAGTTIERFAAVAGVQPATVSAREASVHLPPVRRAWEAHLRALAVGTSPAPGADASIGACLAAFRSDAGLTQEQIARKMSTSRAAIATIENSESELSNGTVEAYLLALVPSIPRYPEGHFYTGSYLRMLREAAGATLSQAAAGTGMTNVMVRNRELGNVTPSPEMVRFYLDEYSDGEVSVDEVVESFPDIESSSIRERKSAPRTSFVFPEIRGTRSLREYMWAFERANGTTRRETDRIFGFERTGVDYSQPVAELTALRVFDRVLNQVAPWNDIAEAWGYTYRMNPAGEEPPDPAEFESRGGGAGGGGPRHQRKK
ncbi:helix-turn-helix domain-containing protein [Nocardia wallacei]|uniref:helix-turn-helix domain-containing protein n=1 Tax=Nocardia wallacei TaxID=480035 RepID=UPI0024540654|nr:helix-turn-helix domain-containing protein [Nocardia wallacei]